MSLARHGGLGLGDDCRGFVAGGWGFDEARPGSAGGAGGCGGWGDAEAGVDGAAAACDGFDGGCGVVVVHGYVVGRSIIEGAVAGYLMYRGGGTAAGNTGSAATLAVTVLVALWAVFARICKGVGERSSRSDAQQCADYGITSLTRLCKGIRIGGMFPCSCGKRWRGARSWQSRSDLLY